jgi:hypothetical protein
MITTDHDHLRRGAALFTLSLGALRPISVTSIRSWVPHMPPLHVGSCFFLGPPPISASAGAPPSLFEGGLLGL